MVDTKELILSGMFEMIKIKRGGILSAHPTLEPPKCGLTCKTSELLATQGWCLWRCDVLNGEVIRIVDEDIVEEAPGGPPVYSIREIETLLELEVVDIRLIHEAKKAVTRWAGMRGFDKVVINEH